MAQTTVMKFDFYLECIHAVMPAEQEMMDIAHHGNGYFGVVLLYNCISCYPSSENVSFRINIDASSGGRLSWHDNIGSKVRRVSPAKQPFPLSRDNEATRLSDKPLCYIARTRCSRREAMRSPSWQSINWSEELLLSSSFVWQLSPFLLSMQTYHHTKQYE